MKEFFQSLFLGIIQGLTEFIPVSSSAHLNIMPWLFGWDKLSESFDLALHAGTLLAILVYFYKDWIELISGGVKALFKGERSTQGRIFWFIAAATVPAGAVGWLLEKGVDKLLENKMNTEMIVIASALIVMGIILFFVDKRSRQTVTYDKLDFKKSFLIGFSQALAGAIPGISRSGITMTVARSLNVKREDAAKYSFLLSAPIVGGGVLLSLGKFTFSPAFFAGIIASFISGMFVIRFLMGYLKKRGYGVFAIYRIVFGVFIIITALVR